MSSQVVVVDYGIGNVYSVCNALAKIGAEPVLTSDHTTIMHASRVILPGVGAFARAMEALEERGLDSIIHEFVKSEKPFLGICIGMQILMDRSTEFGDFPGLGIVPGTVCRIDSGQSQGIRRRVPHIGWSSLDISEPAGSWASTPLRDLEAGKDAVYFVHSYHCVPESNEDRLAIADYDGLPITAAIRHRNVFGVQFHPERSSRVGSKVLEAFLEL